MEKTFKKMEYTIATVDGCKIPIDFTYILVDDSNSSVIFYTTNDLDNSPSFVSIRNSNEIIFQGLCDILTTQCSNKFMVVATKV